jgi:alpha-tubulin suppressor-like RCC1 family protein
VVVAAGHHFAMGLTAEGAIYTWGTNNDGALGDGVDTSVHSTPTRVFGKQRWALPADSRPIEHHPP